MALWDKVFFCYCGDLNEIGHYRLEYLNVYSAVGETVREELGDVALLGRRDVSFGVGFEV